MKKPVELDTKQWALVDSLLHAATQVIGRDIERERVTVLGNQSKGALLWSSEQIEAIRVVIAREALRGEDDANPL